MATSCNITCNSSCPAHLAPHLPRRPVLSQQTHWASPHPRQKPCLETIVWGARPFENS